ncbi:hypothetical protein [Desulfurella sp.]|uniref:hypothetical protein n=1 Tax=Desulfurella sp. TaxID=1962857 RepID=UPI003D0C8857
MFEINLLKNNIPNKINIPKKSKLFFIKFLTISVALILAFCLAILAGFYLFKKETQNHHKNLNTPTKNNITESGKKFTVTNNTFSVVVNLENATSNSTKTKIEQEETIITKKPVSEANTQRKETQQQHVQTPKQNISKPNELAKVAEKTCFVFCNSDTLKNLKSILDQKQINFTLKKIENPKYYYNVYVGGLERSGFSDFKRAIKEKGYNVIGIKILNGKYYVNLGKMNESEKNNFLSAWKNLGFDILVDKQKEISNKDYEVNFACSRDVFEELKQKGFRIKTGRGAVW